LIFVAGFATAARIDVGANSKQIITGILLINYNYKILTLTLIYLKNFFRKIIRKGRGQIVKYTPISHPTPPPFLAGFVPPPPHPRGGTAYSSLGNLRGANFDFK